MTPKNQELIDQTYGEWYRTQYPTPHESDLDDHTDAYWRSCAFHTSVDCRLSKKAAWVGGFKLKAKRDPEPAEIPNCYWGYPETDHYTLGIIAGARVSGEVKNGIWQDSVSLDAIESLKNDKRASTKKS